MLATIMTLTKAREALFSFPSAVRAFFTPILSADSDVTEDVAEEVAGKVAEKVAELAGVDSSMLTQFFVGVKEFILERFGESGLYAAYIATAAISLFILSKLFKISFAILKLVVVPSVALAFAATFVLPYNFFHFLPVTVSLFSVLLLFRG